MREQVQDLLSLVGILKNSIQVFENEEGSGRLLYPNFFQEVEFFGHFADEKLLENLEDLIKDHLEEVQKELDLIKSFRRNFYGQGGTKDSDGNPAVV